jgi:hypothetical protein
METFHTPGPLTLRLQVPAGEIEVEATTTQETTVEVEPLRTDEATLAAVEDTRVELRDRGAGQELRVDVPQKGSTSRLGFLFSRSPEVRVRVVCPEGADLVVRSRSADVDGRGRFTSLDVETTSGDVEVTEVDAAAKVQAVSGDIRLHRIGAVAQLATVSGDVSVDSCGGTATLESVSGDLQLRDAGDAVTLKSVSGDARADNTGLGPVSAQSVSGDVRIGVRPGLQVWIDAASRSGDVNSELAVGEGQPGSGPVAELRLQSVSGDIEIVRSSGGSRPAAGSRIEREDTET